MAPALAIAVPRSPVLGCAGQGTALAAVLLGLQPQAQPRPCLYSASQKSKPKLPCNSSLLLPGPHFLQFAWTGASPGCCNHHHQLTVLLTQGSMKGQKADWQRELLSPAQGKASPAAAEKAAGQLTHSLRPCMN